jgi:hypothetical protein
MKANEARKLSLSVKSESVQAQTHIVYEKIKTACDNGELTCVYFGTLLHGLDESTQSGREVEFAEWAKEQAWQCKKGVGWMKHSDETPYVMTTAELFDLFKTHNP